MQGAGGGEDRVGMTAMAKYKVEYISLFIYFYYIISATFGLSISLE
jgi:hypothetical protein